MEAFLQGIDKVFREGPEATPDVASLGLEDAVGTAGESVESRDGWIALLVSAIRTHNRPLVVSILGAVYGDAQDVVTRAVAAEVVISKAEGRPQPPCPPLRSPLDEAVVAGDVGPLEALLEHAGEIGSEAADSAFALACKLKRDALLDVLLGAGASVDTPDRLGNPALLACALHADTAMLQLLLARGADPCATNPSGNNVLHKLASASGRRARTAGERLRLIAEHPNVAGDTLAQMLAAPNAQGDTPLHKMVRQKQEAALALFLAEGDLPLVARPALAAALAVHNHAGATPLHEAAHLGHTALVTALLGICPPDLRDAHGRTPLHVAGTDRRLGVQTDHVAALLAAGADVNATDDAGATPLHVPDATVEVTRALLAAGADPDAVDAAGRTPAETTLAAGRHPRLVALLEAGATLTPAMLTGAITEASSGATALHVAAREDCPVLLAALAARAADADADADDPHALPWDARDAHGATPAETAVAHASPRACAFVLARCPSPAWGAHSPASHVDAHGQTLLHHAARLGDPDVIAALVAEGGVPVDTAAADGDDTGAPSAFFDGGTPLHIAAQCGHVDAVRALVAAGASVDAQEPAAQLTPLMAAARAGLPGMVALLAGEMGADTTLTSVHGDTAMDIAAELHDPAVLEVLQGLAQ